MKKDLWNCKQKMLTPQVSSGDFSCKKTCFPVNSFMLLYSSSNGFSISGGERSSGVPEERVCLPSVFCFAKKAAWTRVLKFLTSVYLKVC